MKVKIADSVWMLHSCTVNVESHQGLERSNSSLSAQPYSGSSFTAQWLKHIMR